MKKYIPILLVISLVLSACSIGGSNKDDLFEKKQECAKYIEALEKKSKEVEKAYNNLGDFYTENVEEIFYSSKNKTCIALIKTHLSIPKEKLIQNHGVILDLLSNKKITYRLPENFIEYSTKIEKLKGE